MFWALVIGSLMATFMVTLVGMRQVGKARDMLAQLGRALAGWHDATSAWGTWQGVSIELVFAARDGARGRSARTVIDAELPRAYPLALHVRVRERELVVEAAPADVAQVLLDEPTRDGLRHYQGMALETIRTADRLVLRLSVEGWFDTLASAAVALDLVSRLASRVRDAYAEAEQTGAAVIGSAYRTHQDADAQRTAAARRTNEVAQLELRRRAQARRTRRQLQIVFVVAGILTTAGIAVVLWAKSW